MDFSCFYNSSTLNRTKEITKIPSLSSIVFHVIKIDDFSFLNNNNNITYLALEGSIEPNSDLSPLLSMGKLERISLHIGDYTATQQKILSELLEKGVDVYFH